MTTVLCGPQWQGSASSKAPRLMTGARRAAELVPADAVVTVPVLETGGDKAAGIRAFDVLVPTHRETGKPIGGRGPPAGRHRRSPAWPAELGQPMYTAIASAR